MRSRGGDICWLQKTVFQKDGQTHRSSCVRTPNRRSPLATAALFVTAPDWKQPNILPQEDRQIHCDIFMHQNTMQQGDERAGCTVKLTNITLRENSQAQKSTCMCYVTTSHVALELHSLEMMREGYKQPIS